MTAPMIYLDYHATAPLDPRVRDVMSGVLDQGPGNPHSTSHKAGWRAGDLVERARAQVAGLIGARAYEVVFTSGASEANNLAILGAARDQGPGHIITSNIEHPSVLEAFRHLAAREGFTLDIIAVDREGLVSVADIKQRLTSDTRLVSVMFANNEIGTLQPIAEIGALLGQEKTRFHVDATQAAGKVGIDVDALQVDLMSLSAHKLHGPMGIGALYIRSGTDLEPIFHGGAQEAGVRSGTVPVPLAAGFGEACRIAAQEGISGQASIAALRDHLLAGLQAGIPGLSVNGTMNSRLAGNLNVSFAGVRGEDLLLQCPKIAASTGSACASGSQKPSHVLKAIGLTSAEIDGAVRFGLGRFTTQEEVDETIVFLSEAYQSLT